MESLRWRRERKRRQKPLSPPYARPLPLLPLRSRLNFLAPAQVPFPRSLHPFGPSVGRSNSLFLLFRLSRIHPGRREKAPPKMRGTKRKEEKRRDSRGDFLPRSVSLHPPFTSDCWHSCFLLLPPPPPSSHSPPSLSPWVSRRGKGGRGRSLGWVGMNDDGSHRKRRARGREGRFLLRQIRRRSTRSTPTLATFSSRVFFAPSPSFSFSLSRCISAMYFPRFFCSDLPPLLVLFSESCLEDVKRGVETWLCLFCSGRRRLQQEKKEDLSRFPRSPSSPPPSSSPSTPISQGRG